MNWYKEIEDHLLKDERPSDYFKELIDKNLLPHNAPFDWLYQLKEVEQNKVYHPEGNVFNHTMEVVDIAASVRTFSKDSRVFMWASLLHDLGKIVTTKVRKGRITAYNHDIEGEGMARNFLETMDADEALIKGVVSLVRWHMQPLFVYKNPSFSKIEQMKQKTDVVEVGLLSYCDRLGRGSMTEEQQDEVRKVIEGFLKACGIDEPMGTFSFGSWSMGTSP